MTTRRPASPADYEADDPAPAARALREAVGKLDMAYTRLANVRPEAARRWREVGAAFFLRVAMEVKDAGELWTYVADLRALLAQCRRVMDDGAVGGREG